MTDKAGGSKPDVEMKATDTESSKELRLARPDNFSGDKSQTEKFLLACQEYLKINAEVYKSNAAKIAFVLSFFRGGTAENYAVRKRREYVEGNYPDFKTFLAEVEAAFSPEESM
ncbi:hypothetical protein VNI00_015971 [Paramarasmius palmivorus]|uniref:DUF4939 domain-containing protein n=1 Tax=Paramarasmius palmivorus TaxID=297713 RepID=A0AAW0BJH9_9AGAR